MKKQAIIFLLVMLMIFTSLIFAQTQAKAEKKKEPPSIDDQMKKHFFEWRRDDRPGGIVVVVKDGKVVFQKAYGLASMEHKILNTVKTRYDAVSIARPFTAMAIAMLEAEGKLSLDDDVRKHIPELPDFGKTVKIRHLLYHTSGIMDWTKILRVSGWGVGDVIKFDHILRMVKKQKKPLFDPGSKHEISDTNYNLLAETLKRVTGESYTEWFWANIFRPLRMLKSKVRDRVGTPVDNQAYAYDYGTQRGYRRGGDNIAAIGSHCLFSNAEDMAKWLINLESGNVGGKDLFKKLLTPGKLDNGKDVKYAFGMTVGEYKGLKQLSVSGAWEGYNSSFRYFPDQKLAVMIMCNWVSGWVQPVYQTRLIADTYLKDYIKKPKAPAAASAKKAAKPGDKTKAKEYKPDPASYAQYLGDYRWEPGFNVKIFTEKDKLYLRTTPRNKFGLIPISEHFFKLSVADYKFTFQKNKKGKVHQVLILEGGADEVIAPKIKLVKLEPDQLKEYTGAYYAKNLDTRYSVQLKGKSLVVSHPRLSDVRLRPEERDNFATNSRAYPMVEFLRDDQKKISGFKMYNVPVTFKKN
jgi:CubicO group peptidase (beta-lactamase class C family)